MARDFKVEEVENFSDPSSTLQVRLMKYNGKPNLDIRKYYNANQNVIGEPSMKPGKGIALNAEGYDKVMDLLVKNVDEIEEFLGVNQ